MTDTQVNVIVTAIDGGFQSIRVGLIMMVFLVWAFLPKKDKS